MTVRRHHGATLQPTVGQQLADVLFGTPETQAILAQRAAPMLRLVQPQTPPINPVPGITRFAPEPPLHSGPKIGGGTWASVVVGLGFMYFAPKLERWLRTLPIGDLRPTPEEGIEGLLQRLQKETERAIDLANKAAELRRLMEWGNGDSGRAQILRQELAEAQRETPPTHPHALVITNSASSGEAPAPAAAATTGPATDPDDDIPTVDWEAFVPGNDVDGFLHAVSRWSREIKTEVLTHLDRGDAPEDIATWLDERVGPEMSRVFAVQDRLTFPKSYMALRHDLGQHLMDLNWGLARRFRNGQTESARFFCTPNPGNFDTLMEKLNATFVGRAQVGKGSNSIQQIQLAPHIPADLVWRILENLVRNAADHPAGSGPVTVFLDYDMGNHLTVQDNGSGMASDAVQNIRKGVRIHNGQVITTDSEETKGHGYGWQSIRELCAQLDTRWEIESTPGEGTRVTLALPPNFLELHPYAFTDADVKGLSKSPDPDRFAVFMTTLTPAGRQMAIDQFNTLVANHIRFTADDDAVLELPPNIAPPSVLKLPPTMRRPMVIRIADEDPKTGRAYYGLRRLTWVQDHVTKEVVDFYVERLRSGNGFKYPIGIIYDYGESRHIIYEGYNRAFAAIQDGNNYILGKLEESGWVASRDTFGIPDIQIVPLKEMLYEQPTELPASGSEFFEQDGK